MKDLQLLERIWEAGIVGAGGAGFPTHKKLVKGANLLLINAAECEPLLSSDRFVMRHFSRQIVDALCHIRQELSIPVVIGTMAVHNQDCRTATGYRRAGSGYRNSPFGKPSADEQII